jgi:ubiquinone biosynthesis protein
VHFEAGYVPPHHAVEDFAQAIRAIGEPIHDRRADEISMARLLTLLFEVTAIFDMATRTELVMLQKTMVVVEGVARQLDPKLDMWTTAEPGGARLDRAQSRPGRHHGGGGPGRAHARRRHRRPAGAGAAGRTGAGQDRAGDGSRHRAHARHGGADRRAAAKRAKWEGIAIWLIAALLAYSLLS